MSPRRALGITVKTLLVGLAAAVILSEGALVSVRIWLLIAAISAVGITAADLLTAIPFEPARVAPLWRARHRPMKPSGARASGHRSVEVTIASSMRDPRLFSSRLRPRLIRLLHRFAPLGPGIDPVRDPDAVPELLGAEAWLVDTSVTDRSPTPLELARFLDAVGIDTPDEPTAGR